MALGNCLGLASNLGGLIGDQLGLVAFFLCDAVALFASSLINHVLRLAAGHVCYGSPSLCIIIEPFMKSIFHPAPSNQDADMTPAEELRQQIADIEAAKNALDQRTTQYIVMIGEAALQFVMEGRKAKQASPVPAQWATRFAEADAQMIARAIKNAQGEIAHIVPLAADFNIELTKKNTALLRLEQAISVIQWMPKSR